MSEEHIEQALTALAEPEAPATPAPPTTPDPAAAAPATPTDPATPAAPVAPGATPPVVTPPTTDLAALEAHPRFKELAALETSFKPISEALKAGGIQDAQDLTGAIQDSNALVEIASGKQNAGALLDKLEQLWGPEHFKRVTGELVSYLQKKGAIPAGGQPAQTPEQERLAKLEQRFADDEKQRTQAATVQRQQKTVENIIGKLNEFAKAAGVDESELQHYGLQVSSLIGQNPQALKAAENGDFSGVQKIFTDFHNGEVNRFKRWADREIAAKTKRDAGIPKTGTGTVPAPATAPTPDLSNYDARIEHALAGLKQ